MTRLTAGATLVLPDGPWALRVPGPFDLSALVLGADDKVSGDADFVFYNQPSTGGVQLRAATLSVDPAALRRGAQRVMLLASPEAVGGTLGRLPAPDLTVSAGGRAVARFEATGLRTETVVQLAELYRRGSDWKLRALGAGYDDGLAGLARDFGVDVDEEPAAARPAPTAPTAPTAPARQSSVPADRGVLEEVVALTNARRTAHGLRSLTFERRLAAAAQAHNDDMVARGFFAHESPEGASVADRVRTQGYGYRVVAENIAAGQRTPTEVVQGWMDSPGHRRNILNGDIRQIGVGFTEGGSYGTMWTQVFGAEL